VNNEERRLADIMHRVTPEPPRPVTVEQVAYRLVSEPRPGRRSRESRRGREPRARRGGLSRAWAPAAAAAAVVVIAGASAGIALLASSHHNPPPSAGGARASSSVSSASTSPSQTSASSPPATSGTAIAGAPWGAELIDHQTFVNYALVSGDGSLYTYGTGTLDRIDPATGAVAATTRYDPPLSNPPVIVGNTVWVVWSNSGGNVVLHGYDAQTLAQTASILVPATGRVSNVADGILAGGPDGHLYVAAGVSVVVVNPANGQILRHLYLTAGTASSLAVSPDGGTLYVGIGSSDSFKLLVYNLAGGTIENESTLSSGGGAGGLVATSGGIWGATGSGMSEWTWFAPGGNLARAVRVGGGAGGGFDAVPSYSGGVVWIGGVQSLSCASAASGQVLATARVPADHGDAEFFSSPVVAGGHAYSFYVNNNEAHQSGLAQLTPPDACSGVSS
jgi:hypothetical protein